MAHQELIDRCLEGPDLVQHALHDMSEEQLNAAYDSGSVDAELSFLTVVRQHVAAILSKLKADDF